MEECKNKEATKSKIKNFMVSEIVEWMDNAPDVFEKQEIINMVQSDEINSIINKIFEDVLSEGNEGEPLTIYLQGILDALKIEIASAKTVNRFCKYSKRGDFNKGMEIFFKTFVFNNKIHSSLMLHCPMYIEFNNQLKPENKKVFEKARKADSLRSGARKFRMGALHACTFGLSAIASLPFKAYKNKNIEEISIDSTFCQDLFYLKESHMFTC